MRVARAVVDRQRKTEGRVGSGVWEASCKEQRERGMCVMKRTAQGSVGSLRNRSRQRIYRYVCA